MTEAALAAKPTERAIHRAGAVCLAAGLGGAVASIYLAVVSPVGAGSFTFPHGAPEFTGLQMVIAVLRVGLIFGLLGLRWSGAVPMTRSARFGRYGALGMMAALTATEGLAVSVPRAPLDGTPPAYGVIYGAYTALLGVALLAEGLGVALGGAWQGWKRWLPLSLGVWLLVVVLPALALSFDAARWAMSAWLLLFALLGLALTRDDGSAPGQSTAGNTTGTRSARSAAVVTWVYVAAFGSPIIPNAAYVVQNGTLPWFLDVFAMYGGPWTVPFEEGTVLLLLVGFLIVTLAAAWAAWLVWNGSRLGGALSLALLPLEAAFWLGFALPLPWLLGLVRAVLVIATWKSLTWSRTETTAGGGRRPAVGDASPP
jgi:hypothetical protein